MRSKCSLSLTLSVSEKQKKEKVMCPLIAKTGEQF